MWRSRLSCLVLTLELEVKIDKEMHALNINSETMNEKYLGLPVFVGRSQTNVFA